MTPTQQAQLKAYIEGRSDLMALDHNQDGTFVIAQILNAETDPPVYVYRTSLGPDAYTECFKAGAITAAGPAKQGEWENWTGTSQKAINPSDPDARAMIDYIFAGTQAALVDTRNAFHDVWSRPATVFEAIFAGGTGTGAKGDELTLAEGVEGAISGQEIFQIMGW